MKKRESLILEDKERLVRLAELTGCKSTRGPGLGRPSWRVFVRWLARGKWRVVMEDEREIVVGIERKEK